MYVQGHVVHDEILHPLTQFALFCEYVRTGGTLQIQISNESQTMFTDDTGEKFTAFYFAHTTPLKAKNQRSKGKHNRSAFDVPNSSPCCIKSQLF